MVVSTARNRRIISPLPRPAHHRRQRHRRAARMRRAVKPSKNWKRRFAPRVRRITAVRNLCGVAPNRFLPRRRSPRQHPAPNPRSVFASRPFRARTPPPLAAAQRRRVSRAGRHHYSGAFFPRSARQWTPWRHQHKQPMRAQVPQAPASIRPWGKVFHQPIQRRARRLGPSAKCGSSAGLPPLPYCLR